MRLFQESVNRCQGQVP